MSRCGYVLYTDTGADIPFSTAQQQEIKLVDSHYSVEDETRTYAFSREELFEFYSAMRNGAHVSTLPVLSEALLRLFEAELDLGNDVLMLTTSRYLSKTFFEAQRTRETLLLKYPKQRILLVDTLSCSIAQAMLVFEASNMRLEGLGLDEVAQWAVKNRSYINGLLLPESMEWLRKAGLYSGGVATDVLGRRTLFNLTAKGLLRVLAKNISIQRSLYALVESVMRIGYSLEGQIIALAHADAPEPANELRDLLLYETGCAGVNIVPMGPINGAYAGPGALCAAFYGSARQA